MSEYEPVTAAEEREADEDIAALKRELAEAGEQPDAPPSSPGKFDFPIGLDDA